MKKLLIVLVMLFVITGCEDKKDNTIEQKEEISVDSLLLNVLMGDESYVNEKNDVKNINDYYKDMDLGTGVSISYVLLNMDSDPDNEMVIKFDGFDVMYLILNFEDGKVYGFDMPGRGLINLRVDGTFAYSAGADVNGYARVSFDKNELVHTDLDITEDAMKDVDLAEFIFYKDL